MTIEGSVCTRLGFLVPRPSVATLAVRIREGSMYFRIRAWISGGDSEFVWASIIIVAFVWIVGSHCCNRMCVAHLVPVRIRWAGEISRTTGAHQAGTRVSLLRSLHLVHVDHASPFVDWRTSTPVCRTGQITLRAEMFIC
jgi:hypothetical protein